MPLPPDFIERLKAANPIDEVMGSYVTLKRSGRDYVCLCPFHNEKTPSCYVHPDRDFFHCFGCGAGGDVITFTMKYNNLDYMEAVKLLAERGGVPMPQDSFFGEKKGSGEFKKRLYEMNRTAAKFFYSKLKTPEGRQCLDYLVNKRRLSFETIKKYGMGFAPNSWSELKSYMLSEGYTEDELLKGSLISSSKNNTKKTFDFFVNRAMFPFFDLTGHIVGFGGRALGEDDKRKYLNSRDTAVYNKEKYLFSMNFAKNACVKSKQILLCEGNLDVISLNQAGFENAVASCGTALTPQQVKMISNYAESVVICYDSDEAGQKATKKAIRLISETGMKTTVIRMDGAKDPDEYINKFGADRFRHLISGSKDAVSFRLDECKARFDLDTEAGRYEYIREACRVLSELSSRAQREVYIDRLAKETDISQNSINSELDSFIKRERRAYDKKQWRQTVMNTYQRRDLRDPRAAGHRKEVIAEEGIIYYLFQNPDRCENVRAALPPDWFVTDLNKRFYISLTERIENDGDTSLSSFNAEFSPDEMGRLTALLENARKLGIDEAVARDYVKVLKDNSTAGADDIGSDEEFLAAIEKMRQEKK